MQMEINNSWTKEKLVSIWDHKQNKQRENKHREIAYLSNLKELLKLRRL